MFWYQFFYLGTKSIWFHADSDKCNEPYSYWLWLRAPSCQYYFETQSWALKSCNDRGFLELLVNKNVIYKKNLDEWSMQHIWLCQTLNQIIKLPKQMISCLLDHV